MTSGRLKMESFGAGPARSAFDALSPTNFAMDISWRLIFALGSAPSSSLAKFSGRLIITFACLYSMPLSFMPTEAPSAVRNFSSAVFRLSSPPRSSSVTVQAKTGAMCLFPACCTALAVTASTAPLKNSMSSWPVMLSDRFSRIRVRCTISSSVSLGIVSSTLGKGMRPERPAGMAVIEKPPVSGPHLDFRFRGPSSPGDLSRFFFLSFLPSRFGDPERRSFLTLSLFFLSFLFFLDLERSLFTSVLTYVPSSFFTYSVFVLSPSLFSSFFTSPFSSLTDSSFFSPFTATPSIFTAPSFFTLEPSFFTVSTLFISTFGSALILTPTSSLTLPSASTFMGAAMAALASPPTAVTSSAVASSGFSCFTFAG
mmetsp:Transcript_76044/g.163229  ORF Transcript_76044/g.163229 Transcript_76044/m.163229 type:complete len:369 (+) Transcript_76044:759-1865(+)